VGKLPFTYLGLPVGTTRPKIVDLLPLVDCMERRLTASSCFLTQGGKLQLLNSVISSMPIYYLCSLHIPAGIIKQLERIQRQCLWRKYGQDSGKSLAAWNLVCRPKNKGGLGILNLQLQNQALLMKHLNKFYNKEDVPWVSLVWNTYYHERVPHATELCGSFWWKDVAKFMDSFVAVSQIKLGVGDSVLLWNDFCNHTNATLAQKFQRLFSFAKDPLISVKEDRDVAELTDLFNLPLSAQAFQELSELQQILQNHSAEEARDCWTWRLNGKGQYTAKKFYILVHDPIQSNPLLNWIWKSCCILKTKVFAWLVIMDRLNTKDMIIRRHWHIQDGPECVLFPTHHLENRDHLFFQCNFSARIWAYLQIDWNNGSDMFHIAKMARESFNKPFFTVVVFTA
jgi:hypothetical protein